MASKYTEKFIQARLWDHYYQTCPYMLMNMYFFSEENENDMILFFENGLCWELEIKTKHFDFMDDFEKVTKHEKLKKGEGCANKFFYAAPFDLIKVEELPPYAGLIEISEEKIRIKKGAPLLHRNLWNPALRHDRIYKKLRTYINEDMNKVLEDFETKRKNKSSYKKKKYTPKKKHPPQEQYIGECVDEEYFGD